VQRASAKYAADVGVRTHADLAFTAGDLWFLPVEGKHDNVKRLAEFSFVRVIRSMPKRREVARATLGRCNGGVQPTDGTTIIVRTQGGNS
jgi:hypothetical protein